MIEAGDVVVVCVGGAGDAILGADFDWPSAGPLKAAGPKASRHETTTMITLLNMTHPQLNENTLASPWRVVASGCEKYLLCAVPVPRSGADCRGAGQAYVGNDPWKAHHVG